ncbi:hypothetical protein C6P40_000409 [Pichia californica]|uniref:Uncharacterized protein n=1 Tax=Pichia californica TaxID=460514 RepID=A0A9P7BFE9_9ASCO|nr:hypothetical protein C6P42_002251 [[Candida] californica]KAG0688876.1 hypothetical protein C6P40_000409 [[Candida] californica]
MSDTSTFNVLESTAATFGDDIQQQIIPNDDNNDNNIKAQLQLNSSVKINNDNDDNHEDDNHEDDNHEDDNHEDDNHEDDNHEDDNHEDDNHEDDNHEDDNHEDDNHEDDNHEDDNHDNHDDKNSNSLISQLINQLPKDFNKEIENDPNFSDFIKFHKIINKFSPVIESTSTSTENSKSILEKIPKYNWDLLSFSFEYIYKIYNDEINEILIEFDKLDIKRSIWQESAFRLDGERASRKFRLIESWINDSDLYLNLMRNDLTTSVQIIRNTLNKLNNDINNDNINVTP